MNQTKPKEVSTLSIRIPTDLYLSVGQYGLDEELPSLNSAVISLLYLGLEASDQQAGIIKQFILKIVPPEELKEIMNGN